MWEHGISAVGIVLVTVVLGHGSLWGLHSSLLSSPVPAVVVVEWVLLVLGGCWLGRV